ncbi:MAG TPA: serine hydrolase [Longimicrobium sp.]|nr:serine hydrolase [Longimicrobium sp.]
MSRTRLQPIRIPSPRPSTFGRARPLLLAVLACLSTACRKEAPRSPFSEERLARMTTRQKVAQLLMVRAPAAALAPAPGDSSRARLLRWAGEGIGAVELPAGEARAAAALADTLRGVPLPPLVAAPGERGMGGAFRGATELPSADGLALLGDADLAAEVGRAAAGEARALGATLLLASGPTLPAESAGVVSPTLSVDGTAAYAAFVHALAEEGVPPAVAAFRPPSADTALAVFPWDRSALGVIQLDWVQAAVNAGAAAVQPGFVSLPALTADSAPLPLSGVAVQGLIRRDLGFAGLVIADLSPDGALARRYGVLPAAVAVLQVGADILSGVDDPAALADSLSAAVERGAIRRDVLDHAVRRVFAAKRRAGLGLPPADTVRPPLRSAETVTVAARAFERTALTLGPVPALAGCRKPVLVMHPSAQAGVVVSELTRRVPNLLRLNTWAAARRGTLSRLKDFAGNDADCALVVDAPGAPLPLVDRITPAATRDTSKAARRDTARFRADSAAFARDTVTRRMIYISLSADPARRLPAARTAVLVWGAGPQAQLAAVRALFGEIRRGEDERAPAPRVAWPAARTLVRADAKSAAMNGDSLGKIDAILQRGVDGGVFTAAAVAVGRHGRLVKLRGYGRVQGQPVDPTTTLFDVASLTKVVGTTPAVMALVDDGKIRLDAPVHDYLSQFRGGGRGDVTVWNLLTHTSGLPAGDDLYGQTADPAAAFRMVLRTDLGVEPGKRVLYSDFGMILMAEVVHRRAGEPVDRFVARRVFAPLGMRMTMYDPPLVWWNRTAPTAIKSERPYTVREVVHDGNAFRLGGVAGHAGLFSTAGDLAIYTQTLLNGGSYGQRRIWSPRTVQAFTTKQKNAETRALGWDTPARKSSSGDYFSARSYGHTGFTGTSIWIDPERDLFVVLLTNRTYDTGTQGQILDIRRAVADAAARSITDVPIRPRPGTPAAEAEAARERAAARARARARANARRKKPVRRGRGTPRRTSGRRRSAVVAPSPTLALRDGDAPVFEMK